MTTLHDLFPSRYLTGEDLGGQDVTATIRRLDVEEMGKLDKKGETAQKPVLYFDGLGKGLVLNKTNALTIAKMYGDVVEDWRGHAVTLYPKREHAFGSDWTVIRVRPRRPESAPNLQRLAATSGAATNGHDAPAPPTLETLQARWLGLVEQADELGIPLKVRELDAAKPVESLARTVHALAIKVSEVSAARETEQAEEYAAF